MIHLPLVLLLFQTLWNKGHGSFLNVNAEQAQAQRKNVRTLSSLNRCDLYVFFTTQSYYVCFQVTMKTIYRKDDVSKHTIPAWPNSTKPRALKHETTKFTRKEPKQTSHPPLAANLLSSSRSQAIVQRSNVSEKRTKHSPDWWNRKTGSCWTSWGSGVRIGSRGTLKRVAWH